MVFVAAPGFQGMGSTVDYSFRYLGRLDGQLCLDDSRCANNTTTTGERNTKVENGKRYPHKQTSLPFFFPALLFFLSEFVFSFACVEICRKELLFLHAPFCYCCFSVFPAISFPSANF